MAQLQYIKPCWQWIDGSSFLEFPDGRTDKVATVIGVSSFVADGYCMMLSCLFHKKFFCGDTGIQGCRYTREQKPVSLIINWDGSEAGLMVYRDTKTTEYIQNI